MTEHDGTKAQKDAEKEMHVYMLLICGRRTEQEPGVEGEVEKGDNKGTELTKLP